MSRPACGVPTPVRAAGQPRRHTILKRSLDY